MIGPSSTDDLEPGLEMTKRVLITGGYGYLGGRVAQALAAQGWHVSLGTRRVVAAAPEWLPGAAPTRLDWDSNGSLKAACSDQNAVVHLAAMNEIESSRDPVGALRVNGIDSLRLLEAANAAQVPRFVYLSTAHVYGAPLAGVIDETTLPRPAHPYAITHRVAEDFVLAAHDAGKIEGAVLRLSNGFGAPAHAGVDRWTLLANDLCLQAATTRALVLSSAGLQRRDFITLEDVARAIGHVLELPKAELADGLFNVGGDAPMRVVEMAELIAARCEVVLGFAPALQRRAAKPGEATMALDFSSSKLQGTGFVLKRNHVNEIDATLRLCEQAFGSVEL